MQFRPSSMQIPSTWRWSIARPVMTKAETDYLNCPMDEAAYNAFYEALMAAEKVQPKEFEKVAYFEGCIPIEVMAERGRQTMQFGPLKPVGLEHPTTGVVRMLWFSSARKMSTGPAITWSASRPSSPIRSSVESFE